MDKYRKMFNILFRKVPKIMTKEEPTKINQFLNSDSYKEWQKLFNELIYFDSDDKDQYAELAHKNQLKLIFACSKLASYYPKEKEED